MTPRNAEEGVVLVTGATGFLGRHIVRALESSGTTVVALVRRESDADRLTRVMTHPVLWTAADAEKRFAETRVEAVIHTATSYGRRGETREEIWATNVQLPLSLLDCASRHGTTRFVNIDTALPDGLNAYVDSKRLFLAEARSRRVGTALVNVRMQHIYGPGDEPSRFIPHLIRSFLRGVPEVPLTAGEQRRDFIHVDDAARGVLTLLDAVGSLPAIPQAIDLGSGEALPLADIVRMLRQLCGATTDLRFGALAYRDGEPMECRADLGFMTGLGWQPRVGLEQGLRETVESERSLAGNG
ncbi:MAG TPA: NAD(P)-dependent oxidoreductase [Thermoanaerobaculia bacterium]|nr:NAD(P)-dependent oxidoreductase [Thermoanaerobaculia bacterium]